MNDPVPVLLNLTEVKKAVGLGRSCIYKFIQQGRFPAPVKISPRASRWHQSEIVEWIAKQPRLNDKQPHKEKPVQQ